MKIGFEAKRVFHNTTGLGNYGRDLIKSLSTHYPENDYYLYNPKPSQKKLFSLDTNNVREKLPSTSFYKKFKNYWRQKAIVNDLVKDDIVLFHGLSGEIPSGLRKQGIKSIVTIHDLIFVRYPKLYSFFDRKIHFLKFKKAAVNADVVVAISEQTKADIIKYLKIEASKVKVVYQTCNDAFKNEYDNTQKEKVKQKYHLPEEFLLNVGTLEERKNAFSIVKTLKNINTKLVLIGRETKYSDGIKEYIKKHDLDDKVIFLRNVPIIDLAVIYQLATVFIYPSIFEGFGIPIIEALYSKTPVISSTGSCFSEAGGPNSLYVSPENHHDLGEKIKYLLEHPEKRNELKEKGYHYVQQFNTENVTQNIYEIYKSVLK